jgi:hypothetical protein
MTGEMNILAAVDAVQELKRHRVLNTTACKDRIKAAKQAV